MSEPQTSKEEIGAKLMEQRRALYSYVLSCVRDEHRAEDILQDVAQIALGSVDSLRDPAQAVAWLFGIARKRILAEARGAGRQQSLPPDVIELMAAAAQQTQPGYLLHRKQFLMECLEELPEEQRGVIMRRYDGSVENTDQLAESLGRTVQAAYGLVKRIRMKLATCVEQKMADAEADA